MIKTVALEMKWLPTQIGGLFYDKIDHLGLAYWDEVVREMIKKITPKGNNK